MKRSVKKRTLLIISYLTAAAVAFGILAGVNYERARRYELAMTNSYQNAFNQLVTAVGEVDAALQKSVCATSDGMLGSLCTEVFGKAMTAQMALGALPWSCQELEQTSAFISRVGDYAYALSRAAAAGRPAPPEQRENLKRLSEAAGVLSLNLLGVQEDLQSGRLTLTKLTRAETTLSDGTETPGAAGDSVRLIEQEFPETPALIYDGPFSEHLTDASPKALEGLEEVREEAARDIAAAFLGVSRGRMRYQGEAEGEIPCYCFACDGENGAAIWISVTRRGGKILNMLSSRPVGSAAVTAQAAVETARSFLRDRGLTEMAETYHMTQGGVLTVNFAYRQNGVICYSDLIKVAVALDTGEVCGYEAAGYLTAHCLREIPEAAVDGVTAAQRVPPELEILAWQFALVPSDGKYETLCHEFKCAAEDGRHFIIYVNAATGEQEKILILLEDETGTLTL